MPHHLGSWCVALCVPLAVPWVALANGAFPKAGQVLIDPADPAHIVAGSTFGVLMSDDGAKSFSVVCEAGAGYTNVEPPLAVLPDRSILAAVQAGVLVAHGDACDWHLASGIGHPVADVTVSASPPRVAGAVAYDLAALKAWYFESADGDSFTQVGAEIDDLYPRSVDIAPSDSARVYITGLGHGGSLGVIARSIDHGATWQVFDISGATQAAQPFIAAIDPSDPDRLYVRFASASSTLVYTTDGGATWTAALTLDGPMQGATLSPDGSMVLVGGPDLGVWRAPSSTMAFAKVSDASVKCLKWADDGVYGCDAPLQGGLVLTMSHDDGQTFDPLLYLACVEPLACRAGTSVGDLCESAPLLAGTGTGSAQSDICHAGTGGTGGTSASVTASSASGGAGGVSPVSSGCGCSVGAGEERAALEAVVVALLAGTFLRARVKTSKSPSPTPPPLSPPGSPRPKPGARRPRSQAA